MSSYRGRISPLVRWSSSRSFVMYFFLFYLMAIDFSGAASIIKREAREEQVFVPIPIEVESILSEISNVVSEAANKKSALQNILQDPEIQGELLNPDLTYGQVHHILNHLLETIPASEWQEVTLSVVIPSNLVIGLTSFQITDIEPFESDNKSLKLATKSLLKRLGSMTPAQKLAVFTTFIQEKNSRNIDASKIENLMRVWPEEWQGVAMLFKYFGPDQFNLHFDEFEKNLKIVIDKDVNKDAFKIKSDVSRKLSKPQLRVWLEKEVENQNLKKAVAKLEPFVTTLNCHDLEGISTFEEMLTSLTAFNELRPHVILSPFPLDLKYCFMRRIKEVLEERKVKAEAEDEKYSTYSFLDFLETKEIRLIGSVVLSSFPIEVFETMKNEEIAKQVLKEIGSLPIIDLITSISLNKTEKLADLAVDKFGLKDKRENEINHKDLSNLGTLVSFTSSDILDKASKSAIKAFLKKDMKEEFHKIGCFPGSGIERWNRAITKTYGDINTWVISNLTEIGSFIITLDEFELSKLNKVYFFYYLPNILESNEFFSSYDRAPIHTNYTSVASVCKMWLGEEKNVFAGNLETFFDFALKFAQLRTNLYEEVQSELQQSGRNKRQAVKFNHLRMVERKLQELMQAGRLPMNFFPKFQEIFSQYNNLRKEEIENFLGQPGILKDIKQLPQELFDLQRTNKITEEQYSQVGRILDTINDETARAFAKVAKITHVDLELPEKQFCAFYENICSLPEYPYLVYRSTLAKPELPDVSPETIQATDLPTDITCEGIKKFGSASESIRMEIFEKWSKEEFEQCLEYLGSISFSLDKKLALWELMKMRTVHVTKMEKIPPKYMIILNNLLEAVAMENMKRLNLTVMYGIEAISLLGQFQFESEKLSELAKQIDADSGNVFPGKYLDKNLESSDVLIFGSMKHLVCGFWADKIEDEVLEIVLGNDEVAKFLLPMFGTLKACPNKKILKQMADSALKIYGSVDEWNSPLIMSLGIIVAGLSPENFGKIGECCVNSISRETFAHLDFAHIDALGPEKIMLLPPESLTALAKDHLQKEDQMLSKESVMALNATIESVEEHHHLTEAAQALKATQELLETAEEKEVEGKAEAESSSTILTQNVIPTLILCFHTLFKMF